jgi:dUTP pyrophosphatase
MEELEVFVARREGAGLPEYATPLASGVDLIAFVEEPLTIGPFERLLIPTGLYVSIPEGYEAQIRPRSGIAYKFGVTVLNSPGTIDADYRGEIKVLLANLGSDPFTVKSGDRIAQMVFAPVVAARWKSVDSLPDSERGQGGFGSTGMGTSKNKK